MISGILEQSLRDVPRTNWGAMYCDTRLSVCLFAHLRNRTNKFRKIFWTTVCGSGLYGSVGVRYSYAPRVLWTTSSFPISLQLQLQHAGRGDSSTSTQSNSPRAARDLTPRCVPKLIGVARNRGGDWFLRLPCYKWGEVTSHNLWSRYTIAILWVKHDINVLS